MVSKLKHSDEAGKRRKQKFSHRNAEGAPNDRRQLIQLRIRLEDQKNTILSLQSEIRALQSSTSWSVTAPLRALKHHSSEITNLLKKSVSNIRSGRSIREAITNARRTYHSRLPKENYHLNASTGSDNARHYINVTKPLISVIIVNHNGCHHLQEALESLRQQTYRNTEILVVDNNSTDGSRTLLSEYPEVKTIHLPYNAGFAEANNIAFEQSRGDLIALLNNVTRAVPFWLEHLLQSLEVDDQSVSVAPKLRFWSVFVVVTIASPNEFRIVWE